MTSIHILQYYALLFYKINIINIHVILSSWKQKPLYNVNRNPGFTA